MENEFFLINNFLEDSIPFQHSFETFSHLKAIYSRDLGWLGEAASSVRYPPFDGTNKGKYMSFLMQNRYATFIAVITSL